jgi:hypothetical protein
VQLDPGLTPLGLLVTALEIVLKPKHVELLSNIAFKRCFQLQLAPRHRPYSEGVIPPIVALVVSEGDSVNGRAHRAQGAGRRARAGPRRISIIHAVICSF